MYKVDGCNYDWKNFLVTKYFIIIFTNQKKESFMEDEDFGSDFMLRVKSMKADKFTYKQIKLTETLIKEKKHIIKDFEKCKNKLRLCPAFQSFIDIIKICNDMSKSWREYNSSTD